MELKSYQKKVIADLTRYLELLNETKNYEAAFRFFWQEKSAPTLGYYQDILPGVPNLCFKVPTGGGKTFIACNAIRPIFDALPVTKTKAVVWLVPSDAILAQTVKSLKDTQHPYRQKIDVDFGGRVEVYTKQELLNGQNFNPTTVTEQLSIMVLSYDSFRGRGKEGLKAYQENSNLAEFAKVLGKPDSPIEKADETALFQIINQLNPLVIVDESHHARSDLSLEMLENFNPCFVLDLTATPKKESNIASLANKTSQVDVEQILGRILRLPHTSQHTQVALNMSYVLTSSNDFNTTVQHIIKGLNSAGFSDKDYRLAEPVKPQVSEQPPVQIDITELQGVSDTEAPSETEQDDFAGLDGKSIGAELERRREQEKSSEITPKADSMLDDANKAGEAYNNAVKQGQDDPQIQNLPWEVREQLATFRVRPQFQSDLETLVIPQFFQVIPDTLFTEGTLELLEKEQLAEGFALKGKAYDIDFAAADDEIAEVDVRANEGGLPKVFKMTSAEQRYFKEYFNNLPPESRVRQCKDMMFNQLNKLNMVDAAELKSYINRIVDDMDKAQIAAMEKAPLGYAKKIKEKIESLLDAHYRETFAKWLETERIVCQPSYRLPSVIHPTTSTDIYGGSLYEAEDGDINKLEQDLIMELTALPNVRWWHRNLSRHGFAINGYIKHYPDIMIMTQSGKIIFAETKGEHLKNDDSREKIELGRAWRTAAGSQYRYYMVFRDGENLLPGAVSMSQFVETIKAL